MEDAAAKSNSNSSFYKKTQKKIGSLESIQAFWGADFCAAFSERAILRQLPHESMLKCVLVELLVKFRVKIIVVF